MLVNIQALLDEAKCYEVVRQSREDESGASGAGINLPIHTEIYSMAQRQEFDVLIVRGIARLSRNRTKQLIVEQELRRVGVRIEYVIGEYPDSPEGDLPKPIWARAITHAFAPRPVLMLADEPITNLDTANGKRAMEIMQRLNEKTGTVFVVALPDLRIVACTSCVVKLRDRHIDEIGAR